MWSDGCSSPCPSSGVVRGRSSVVSIVPANIEVPSTLPSPWRVKATRNLPIFHAPRSLKRSSLLVPADVCALAKTFLHTRPAFLLPLYAPPLPQLLPFLVDLPSRVQYFCPALLFTAPQFTSSQPTTNHQIPENAALMTKWYGAAL